MKRIIKLKESDVRRMITESVKRVLRESFTNMEELYHKTSLDRFVNILKTNRFYLIPTNHNGRGGKYYASLTRYKNDKEGYDIISRNNDMEGLPMGSCVTIAFNIPKMSHIHGIQIKPFDFYGTYDKDREDISVEDNGISSKVIYQQLNQKKGEFNDKINSDDFDVNDYIDDVEAYDDPEFYNMSEENIISDTVTSIPNIVKYINYVEVYFPTNDAFAEEEYDDDEDVWMADDDYGSEDIDRTMRYGYAFYKLASGTEWENKIIINVGPDRKNPSANQRMSLRDFRHWFRDQENYKEYRHRGKKIVNRKPLSRKDVNNQYAF